MNCDLQVSVDGSESKGKNDRNDGNSGRRSFNKRQGTGNRCVVACTAIKKITCLLIAPKS